MPQYPLITLEEVRVGAKIGLGLMENNSYDYAIDFFTFEGILHLDNMRTFRPFAEKLFFEDGKAQLPCNYISFLALKGSIETPSTDGDNPISTSGSTPYYVNNIEYLKECNVIPDPRWTTGFGQVQIIDGCISAGIDGYATLVYNGYDIDSEGRNCIISIASRALRYYAMAEFGASKPDMYPNYRYFQQQWVAQKSWLKGELWQQYVQENKQKVRQWMAALVTDQW
jgi:hypothetical protein